MTETDAHADRATLVPGVHRLIRALEGKEGPFAGTLVAFDDGVAVCVDIERLEQWAGWAFSDAEHVCGVLDIRRRADGHDALLPWCTQRVEVFVGRRSASDSPLTPGELGTLVASLLRGVRELGADADAVGDWWLTGDGRPLFVHGDGGSARARTAALIERMTRHHADRGTIRAMEEMTAALRQPRHPVDDDRRWEEQLFARAAPRALQLDVFAPERVSDQVPRLVAADVAARGVESGRRRERRDRDEGRSPARRRYRQDPPGAAMAGAARLRSLAEHARQSLGLLRERTFARRALRPDTESVQTPKVSRRRSFVVAGALGAVVLIVGLLWPSDGDGAPAEASSQRAAGSGASAEYAADGGSAPPTPAPTPTESADRPAGGGALDAVPALLDAIEACVASAVEYCPGAVAEGAHTPSDGLAILGATASTSALVDDYGDVAVIRLTPIEGDGVEQMMVLERHNEIWLVRDVYDVAYQPE